MQLLPAGLSLLFLMSTATLGSSHNITAILNNFPEFSFFNLYLTQTHLAPIINTHKTITVCAIDNAGMAQLLSKPLTLTAMKRFLSVHILVDYFGAERIQQISDGTLPAPTMFQAMGARKFNILMQNVGGQVTLKTKLVDAKITHTLYDQQPLAIYRLDNILLPRELFTPNLPKPLKKKNHQVSEYPADSPVSAYPPLSSVSPFPAQSSYPPLSSGSEYEADSSYPPLSSGSEYHADSSYPPLSSVSEYQADSSYPPLSSVSPYPAESSYPPLSSVSGYLADSPYPPLSVSGPANAPYPPLSSLHAYPADSPRSLVSSD